MQPQPLAEVHPFTPTMKNWRHSIEVDCGPDWSWDVIETAIERGPHLTACTADAYNRGVQQGDAVGGHRTAPP